MYNWSVDTKNLKKNQAKYQTFILEQGINFGLNGKRLSLGNLKKYWPILDIDTHKKAFLQKIVWPQFSPGNKKKL